MRGQRRVILVGELGGARGADEGVTIDPENHSLAREIFHESFDVERSDSRFSSGLNGPHPMLLPKYVRPEKRTANIEILTESAGTGKHENIGAFRGAATPEP
ncbi:hypothetical protein [Methylosinus sp. Sm6]|uniref:hypothetical protein n=1 Tax=Methylosinus sp. Sm6 TaxID=2866948 RepID=UPI001C9A22E8|nr:hypothetical protein [Methylosinus sp. Sm6]MBY6242123.1 hypothetical protein [Methylosinus sp. Sm6]